MVDGVFVRPAGAFTRLDEEAIVARARQWCAKFEGHYRAGLGAGRPMLQRVAREFQPLSAYDRP
jgi:hypothetical protein